MQEIELKFLVPDYKHDALMRRANVKAAQTTHLAAYYFDTPQQQLADAGMALRIRKEGDDWVQTLKANGDGISARLEHNHTLEITEDEQTTDASGENVGLFPDLDIYEQTQMAEPLEQLSQKKLRDTMTCQYITDVQRITRLIKKDGNIIEVAFDKGVVKHGNDDAQKQTIQEIEFELLQGDVAFLFETAKSWCKRHHLCLSTVTKAERGGLVLVDKSHSDATKANLKRLAVNKSMSISQFLPAIVHNCLLQILPNASAIADGSEDGNHVHQLRVGIRRLRTLLKFFAQHDSRINPEWQPILKQTFGLLGDYRDREILQIKTQPMLEQIGAPKVDWQPELDSLKIKPIDAVRANDFQLTLLELIEYAQSNTASDVQNDDDKADTQSDDVLAKDVVKEVINKLFKKISKASDKFAELDIEAQHDVRKRLKSLRYLCEFSAPLFKKKKTKKFLKYLEPVQDTLGDYNDDLVGHDFYLQKTTNDANAWFAVGWFLARQPLSAQLCAKSLQQVKGAPKFW